MFSKSRLKELFAQYGFRPLKRLGANYLIDHNIKDKIIDEARVERDDVILEIGPGLGALTVDLAESGARIYAVEKDRRACAILKEIVGADLPNLEILNEDILRFDLKKRAPRAKRVKVIGNLPYYITTPILEYLIDNRTLIESATLVVQKDLARRLMAEAGTKERGSISCLVQYYTRPEYIYTIKRTSFYPSPEVDSSLIRFAMLSEAPVAVKDETLFFKIIRGSFNQRRKTIVNSLSRKEVLDIPKVELSRILDEIGIAHAARAETLKLSDFAAIANALCRP